MLTAHLNRKNPIANRNEIMPTPILIFPVSWDTALTKVVPIKDAPLPQISSSPKYSPDCWFSPDSVSNMGRPYPYMIFKNMEKLKVSSVKNVIKVGDTVYDINEGIDAGVVTVGVIEGSSIMALSETEYKALNEDEKAKICNHVREVYEKAGADYVISNLSELPVLIQQLS